MNTVDSRKVNKKVLESLTKAAALILSMKRSQIFHLIREKSDKLMKKDKRTDCFRGTCSDQPFETATSFEIPDMEELPSRRTSTMVRKNRCFYFSQHPLSPY